MHEQWPLIRVTVCTDAAALSVYRHQILRQTEFMLMGPEDPLPTLVEEGEWIGRYAEHPNSVQVVALATDDSVVGLCSITGGEFVRSRHVGTLSVSVLTAYQRQGLGRRLVQTCLEWAERNRNLYKVNLHVHATNVAARRLYHGLGFEIEGTLRGEAQVGQDYVDLVAMGLLLRRHL